MENSITNDKAVVNEVGSLCICDVYPKTVKVIDKMKSDLASSPVCFLVVPRSLLVVVLKIKGLPSLDRYGRNLDVLYKLLVTMVRVEGEVGNPIYRLDYAGIQSRFDKEIIIAILDEFKSLTYNACLYHAKTMYGL